MVSIRPASQVKTFAWKRNAGTHGSRVIPEESAVALTYNGTTHAVMMATPLDLEDYALGFSLTEQQIGSKEQIQSIDIEELDDGIDIRIWLDADTAAGFRDRRRRVAGPTGCGLCGIESLQEANKSLPVVNGSEKFDAWMIGAAQETLFSAQRLHAETRAVHAAGFWTPADGLLCMREDVGRHNALDKLVGAMMRQERSDANGLLLLTSRISVEMVQKAAILGSPVVVALSAPTALAVRTAERAGITLVTMARNGGFEIFTHAQRVKGHGIAHRAG